MKKLFTLAMVAFAALTTSLSFSSCSQEDDFTSTVTPVQKTTQYVTFEAKSISSSVFNDLCESSITYSIVNVNGSKTGTSPLGLKLDSIQCPCTITYNVSYKLDKSKVVLDQDYNIEKMGFSVEVANSLLAPARIAEEPVKGYSLDNMVAMLNLAQGQQHVVKIDSEGYLIGER